MNLYVDMTPFKTKDEKTVLARAGEAVILELPPIESHPLPSVAWQTRDNTLLYGSKFAITKDFHQVVLDVSSSDQKAYRARATNTQLGQEETSGYIQLVVTNSYDNYNTPDQIQPSIVVPPSDAHIIKGTHEHELYCIVNARPLHELEIIWLKDGNPIEMTGISTSFNDLWNRTLSLLRVEPAYSGEYTCQARLKNSLFPVQSASAKISVLGKSE